MPNDAKFGLVFGVGLVLLIALLFFRKEPALTSVAQQPEVRPVMKTTPPQRPAPKKSVPKAPEPIVETPPMEPLEEVPPLPPPPVM